MQTLFRGRFNRTTWLLASLVLETFSALFIKVFPITSLVLLSIVSGIFLVAGAFIDAGRFRDTGKSGYFAAFTILPLAFYRAGLLGFFYLGMPFKVLIVIYELLWDIFLLFKKGDPGTNVYGSAPHSLAAYLKRYS